MDARVSEGSPRTGATKVRDTMAKPASPYLQEHLQARREHPKRTRRSDFGSRSGSFEDDIFLVEAQANSPLNGSRSSRHGTPAGDKTRDADMHKALGARELDKHIDKLSKLNFDLKMELFHCRERMVKLQEQCDRMEERAEMAEDVADKAEHDRRTLLEINEEMVKELEKRDEAVKEAVTIICDLEEKVETLEHTSTASQESCSEPIPTPFDSPEGCRKPLAPGRARKALSPGSTTTGSGMPTPDSRTSNHRRVPSFLCDKKPSTNALRSVYLEPASKLHAVKSYNSLLSQRDELADADEMDSPRLSVLSESSFPSIYSPKKSSAVREAQQAMTENAEVQQGPKQGYDRYRSDNSRISEWVANRVPSGQQPRFRQTSSEYRYQSLDDPIVYGELQAPFDEHAGAGNASQPVRRKTRSKRHSLGAPVYGQNMLPPTPDSVSTRLLRDSQSSRSSLGATSRTADTLALASKKQVVMSWRQNKRLSSSEEESEEDMVNDDLENASGTVHGIGEGQYPNGGSIVTGTPSRFQVRHASPPANNILFDGDGIRDIERPRGKRRNTSGGLPPSSNSTPRASLPRSETSPALHLPIVQKPAGGRLARSETTPSLLSPVSGNSTSSQRQQLQYEEEIQCRPTTTDKPRLADRLRSPPKQSNGGVRAAISQKTHNLFKRRKSIDSPASPPPHVSRTNNSHLLSSSHQSQSPHPRPRTAHPPEPSPSYPLFSSQKFADAGDARPRPVSQDSGVVGAEMGLALMAANQALEKGRRQSFMQQAGSMSSSATGSVSGGGARGFFKRAGSVRR